MGLPIRIYQQDTRLRDTTIAKCLYQTIRDVGCRRGLTDTTFVVGENESGCGLRCCIRCVFVASKVDMLRLQRLMLDKNPVRHVLWYTCFEAISVAICLHKDYDLKGNLMKIWFPFWVIVNVGDEPIDITVAVRTCCRCVLVKPR
jgi:hypothetical protein